MGLRQVKGLVCHRCGARAGERSALCADCGPLGLLEYAYDYEEAARTLDRDSLGRRETWMWRYRELLPLDELAETPNLQVGMTPVSGAPRLAAWLGLAGLWLKDEGRSPTGSIEDRASALCVAQARDSARKVVAVASDGAAAPSCACFAAATGLSAVVFATADACAADLSLATLFGATILEVAGSKAAARELCEKACHELKWFDGTALASAFPFEAKKTAGHEIAEQLEVKMPDWVAVADDEGETVASVARGLEEMRTLKLARQAPRLLRVVRSRSGKEPAFQRAEKLVQQSEGETVTVAADGAAAALLQAARQAALLVDEDGARAIAGLRRAVEDGVIQPSQTALALVGGRRREAAAPAKRTRVGNELARVERAMTRPGQAG